MKIIFFFLCLQISNFHTTDHCGHAWRTTNWRCVYMQITQGNKTRTRYFFVTKIRFRIKLPVIMYGTVNRFPIPNSDPGNAIHTAVSHYQHVSWTDNQSKSDIPITGNQKIMFWACVKILFIFVLKAILNPIKNVFKTNKGKNCLIN